MNLAIDGIKIKEIVDNLIDNILKSGNIMASLYDIRSVDDYTFSHCVNVCIYSLIIGVGLGHKGDKLHELGMGSILHDIGKVKVPINIIKKPTPLDQEEFDEVKKHTIYGYEILKSVKDMPISAANIALLHHERIDGSGYPNRYSKDDIDRFSRIVAVSDVYDALTTNRLYRKKLMPHEVLDYISSLSGVHYDAEVVNVLVRCVAHYPIGTGVVLNSNEKGIVSYYNKSNPTRHIVRLVIDEDGKMLKVQKEIDNSKEPHYKIMGLWDV